MLSEKDVERRVAEGFRLLRFSVHHIGLGDVRLSQGVQEAFTQYVVGDEVEFLEYVANRAIESKTSAD